MFTQEDDVPVLETPCFSCLGEVGIQCHRWGLGYVKSGFMKSLFKRENVTKHFSSNSVLLFGRRVNIDLVLFGKQKELFCCARKNFLEIFNAASRASKSFGMQTNLKEKNYSCLRKQICELINFINVYFSHYWDDDTSRICKWIIPDTMNNLQGLHSLFKSIPDMPEYIISSRNIQGDKCEHAVYHLFHLHLDVDWYYLVVLFRLEQLSAVNELEEITVNASEDLKKHTEKLAMDLVKLAVRRFEKLPMSEVKKNSPFSCSCIKELWLLLQIFEDEEKLKQQCDFWALINHILGQLCASSKLGTESNYISCSNPVGFCLWMLVHLGRLYFYTEEGEYEGASCARVKSNYSLLEKALKTLLSADTVSEAQLRLCIPLIMQLVTEMWPSQKGPIITLWEYFHHRLNSYFFLQGATPDSISVASTSGACMMQQVQSILNLSSKSISNCRVENSFQMFVRFLGIFLRNCPSQWSSIKGRIFSKFSQTKMLALKEMGMYNFSILFLTMAYVGNTKEVGNKLQELLCLVSNSPLDFSRRNMVWKSHTALLQLYILKGMDIADSVKPLMEDVKVVSTLKDCDTTTLFRTLVDGLRNIIMSSKELEFSEYTLLGKWIPHYLESSVDSGFLLSIIQDIIVKVLEISKQIGLIEYNAPESHLTHIYKALCENILPYIKGKFAHSDNTDINCQVADLAVSITVLALNRANVGVSTTPFTHYFESFAVNAHPVNSKLSVRYVCCLLEQDGILSELEETYSDYPVLIVQTWLRCSVYIAEDDSCRDLSHLTQIVSQLPDVKSLCQEASVDLQTQAKPLASFISMLGKLFRNKDSITAKTEFREKCTKYLTPMVKCFERMLRVTDLSEKQVARIYQVAALLIVDCGAIIYTRSNPYCIFNILLNQLLLPIHIFKPGALIHPYTANALRRTLCHFVRGVAHLNMAHGNTLLPTVKNLVVHYFTRLVGKSSVSSHIGGEGDVLGHPLLMCFRDGEDKEVSKLVLQIIDSSFIKMGDPKTGNNSTSLALMFLMDLLKQKDFSTEVVSLIIDVTLHSVLEIIIISNTKSPALKRQANNLLKEILSKKVNDHPELSQRFLSVLLSIIRQYSASSGLNVLSMLNKLCELSPNIMTTALRQIKEIMGPFSPNHGSEYSMTLKAGLDNIEKTLSVQL